MMKAKFKIGDQVWTARYQTNTPIQIPCPVCFGKLKVTLILGNDDKVELPCDYCGKRNLGVPRGYDTEYQVISSPESIIITTVKTEETEEGLRIQYQSGCRIFYMENVFATRKEAELRGEELKEAHLEEMKKRQDYIKADTKKSFAWNAGYHLREAKRAEKDAKYHRGKAVLCKAKVKTKGKTNATNNLQK